MRSFEWLTIEQNEDGTLEIPACTSCGCTFSHGELMCIVHEDGQNSGDMLCTVCAKREGAGEDHFYQLCRIDTLEQIKELGYKPEQFTADMFERIEKIAGNAIPWSEYVDIAIGEVVDENKIEKPAPDDACKEDED